MSTEPGSRRHVTILFSDLCASTQLGHTYDPEILAEILHHVKAAAHRVVPAHGGIVNQVYGDGVLAVFGFPLPDEDDVRRATRAALDLHEEARATRTTSHGESFEIRLHSGIHSGLVVAGAGDPVRGRYELIGDPVNTAAGLCAHAGPDEIVVSASTIRGALPFFATEELPSIALKGKPQPIPAYRVLGRSAVDTRYEARVHHGLTPYVGREDELERLEACLEEARAGRLQVVALIGDAGLGKTRAIEEFIDQRAVSGCCTLRGRCESYGSIAPLQPFSAMLGHHFGLVPGAPPERSAKLVESQLDQLGLAEFAPQLLRLLSLRPAPAVEEGGSNASAVRALTAFFEAISSTCPLIVFVDDWQWIDDASRQVVETLMRAAADKPVLIVAASRVLDPADTTLADAELLFLEPFTEDESRRTIACLLPDRLDLGIAARLQEQSGGNPLFLEELCRSQAEWASRDSPSGEGTPVPTTLHGLIEARVGRLPTGLADLVHAAAVVGNIVPSWLLQEITGYGEDDEVVRQLAGHDLIYKGEARGTLRFKHGLTRDFIYESVGLRARQALHLQIAAAVEKHSGASGREEHCEALAYHYARGGNPFHAADYAELAGDKALAGMSLDRARQQYQVAMSAIEQLSPSDDLQRRWIAISLRWVLACVYSPSGDDLAILRKAASYARALDNIDALAQIRYWLGWFAYALGDQGESIRNLEAALAHARDLGNPGYVAQFQTTLGQSQAAACLYPQAFENLREGIENKRRFPYPSGVRSQLSAAYADATRACALGELGDFEEANALIERSLESIRGIEDAIQGSIRALQALILNWQGRWRECIEAAALAQATAKRVNGAYVFAMSRAESAFARYQLDGTAESLASLQQSTDWLVARGMCLFISLNFGWLADTMARAGEIPLSKRYAEAASARARVLDPIGEGMACRAMARLAAAGAPDLQTPDHYLEAAMHSALERDSRRERALNELARGELALSRGQRAEGLDRLGAARSAFLRMHMSWHAGEAEALIQRA